MRILFKDCINNSRWEETYTHPEEKSSMYFSADTPHEIYYPSFSSYLKELKEETLNCKFFEIDIPEEIWDKEYKKYNDSISKYEYQNRNH